MQILSPFPSFSTKVPIRILVTLCILCVHFPRLPTTACVCFFCKRPKSGFPVEEGVAELLPDEPFVPQQRGLQVTTGPVGSASASDGKPPRRGLCCQ